MPAASPGSKRCPDAAFRAFSPAPSGAARPENSAADVFLQKKFFTFSKSRSAVKNIIFINDLRMFLTNISLFARADACAPAQPGALSGRLIRPFFPAA